MSSQSGNRYRRQRDCVYPVLFRRERFSLPRALDSGFSARGLSRPWQASRLACWAVHTTKLTSSGRALQQVERNDEAPAGFFVIHPDDWATIRDVPDESERSYDFCEVASGRGMPASLVARGGRRQARNIEPSPVD
jgi:hypothetical protein